MADIRAVTLIVSFWFHISSCWLFEVENGKSEDFVTCGSVLKLMNDKHKVRLNSPSISYGTGSGQQSVTATQDQLDHNSHWAIKGELNKPCTRGEPVKCGSVVRLSHLATHKHLHSHKFRSPLSGKQEVSAYGNDEESDTGDHWQVVCDSYVWGRSEKVMLKHADTGAYLAVTLRSYNRPIFGHMEVVGVDHPGSNAVRWHAAEGVFVRPTPRQKKSTGVASKASSDFAQEEL